MSQFSKGGFSGNRGGFRKSGGGQGARGFGGPKEMFEATCAECGNSCQVPFRPNGRKPVFCNDCFKKEESPRKESRDFAPRNDFGGERQNVRPDQAFNDLKAELRMVNKNLERLISLLTQKPVEKMVEVEKPLSESKSKEKVSKKKKLKK
jgi:CxxC-x17-CxxC domain-containing protein